MSGRISVAVRVRGEHPGEAVRRLWTFAPSHCAAGVCRRLRVRRQRSDHKYSTLVLRRVADGAYVGHSRFFVGLLCRDSVYRYGEVVPYTIEVRVLRASRIDGIEFATRIAATYTNAERDDRTICPIGPSHDAARYRGRVRRLPSPPRASFTFRVSRAGGRLKFSDTSERGIGGARIVAQRWRFGDPASGKRDHSRRRDPSHRFSAPGTYHVSLSVRDANGLRSEASSNVTVASTPLSSATSRSAG